MLVFVLSALIGTSQAQDFNQTYTFIDGTTLDYPDSFVQYNETIDEFFIANNVIDMYIFTLYEYTQRTRELDTLEDALDWYFNDFVIYILCNSCSKHNHYRF